jgi:NADH-ubiquinone oxidoreductase chain 5
MEGPTPVSALLHAATMVTAGVFLIIRASLIFEYSSKILILLIIFGTITALFSSMIAVFQYDIKKIIAYSTCSQLGYMFFSCGLSNYNVAFFHLFNHAFFKSLLFLSAGVLIHSLFDEQDIRKMGNLIYMLNFVYFSILIGSLAILGFPFLSGFYSKDLILELVYSRYIFDSIYIYLMALIAALFTSIYSLKIIFYVFFHKINTNYIIYEYFMKNKVEV